MTPFQQLELTQKLKFERKSTKEIYNQNHKPLKLLFSQRKRNKKKRQKIKYKLNKKIKQYQNLEKKDK